MVVISARSLARGILKLTIGFRNRNLLEGLSGLWISCEFWLSADASSLSSLEALGVRRYEIKALWRPEPCWAPLPTTKRNVSGRNTATEKRQIPDEMESSQKIQRQPTLWVSAPPKIGSVATAMFELMDDFCQLAWAYSRMRSLTASNRGGEALSKKKCTDESFSFWRRRYIRNHIIFDGNGGFGLCERLMQFYLRSQDNASVSFALCSILKRKSAV